jgi:membrane-bound lytic murein transglycosylase A
MVHQTMKTRISSAPSASTISSHMGARAYRAAALALLLAGCASVPPPSGPAPVEDRVRATPPNTAPAMPGARWTTAAWTDLPGWNADRTREAWSALRRSCQRPAPAWQRVCAEAQAVQPADDDDARAWFELRLVPFRVSAADGNAEGLATGYFEPQLDASRAPRGALRHALHQPPADLATRKPWYTRAQLDALPAVQAALRGREIAHLADPLDVLLVQVQGSARLRITEPDGRVTSARVSYAGHNGHAYVSLGRWLLDKRELTDASWPAIRDWAKRHPTRVSELLAVNPRLVFFREEPLPDAGLGPRGSQGVALTAERSIAVDPGAIPLGTPVWLDTTEPLSATPLRRLVLAQDTGSAITGAVRADYFWGSGERAEAQAGRMKQPLRLWALWPR